jgi:hypothetical protein
LGHQACGALSRPDDWCHEEITWWRPPYLRNLDRLAGLDRKSLPFSYLVFAKSKRSRAELLPKLAQAPSASKTLSSEKNLYRVVSPAHPEGKEAEFFICGQDGKRRARYRPSETESIGRGSILIDTELRGDPQATRITQIKTLV